MKSSFEILKRAGIAAGLIVPVLLFDRITKEWAAQPRIETPGFLSKMIRITYVQNTGIAFGAFQGSSLLIIIATALIIMMSVLCLFRYFDKGLFLRTGLCLIVAGGMGNLYDRIVFGFVADFIELVFVRFAVFNVADMAVVVGSVLLIIGFMRAEGKP